MELPPPQIDKKLWDLLWKDIEGNKAIIQNVDQINIRPLLSEPTQFKPETNFAKGYEVDDEVMFNENVLFPDEKFEHAGWTIKGTIKKKNGNLYDIEYMTSSGRDVAEELRELSNEHYKTENKSWYPRIFRVLAGEMEDPDNAINSMVCTHSKFTF